MFNINTAIAILRDAETIVASPLLTEDEKGQLLNQLRANIPPSLNRGYLQTITDSLKRVCSAHAAAQAGATEGQQDAPQVAPGFGAAIETATSWPTNGQQEQAEITERLGGGSDDGGAATEAPEAPQKAAHPKAARKHRAA